MKLYRYVNHELITIELSPEESANLAPVFPDEEEESYLSRLMGTRGLPLSGYVNLKDAKEEEIEGVKEEIAELEAILDRLYEK